MRIILQLVLISLVFVSGSAAALSRVDIREVQWLLNELGYPAGPDDGIVGHNTTRAVTSFRNERGFPGGNSIDLPLLRQLRATATDQGIALSKRDIRTIQRLLEKAGYPVGSVDGVVGLRTRRAAENYRRSRGFVPNSSIDRTLLSLLRGDPTPSPESDEAQSKSTPISSTVRPATAPQTATRVSPLAASTPSASQLQAISESSRLHSTDGTITKRLIAAVDSLAQSVVSKIGRPNHSKSVYIKSFVFADTQRPYPAITERIDAELRQKLTAYGKNSGVIVSKSERHADFTLAGSFNGKNLVDGFKLVSVLFGDAEKPLHEAAYWIQETGQNCLLLDDDSLRARIFGPKHLHFVTELRESARRKLFMEWNALDLSSRIGAGIDAQVRHVIATSTAGARLTWPYRSEKSAEVAGRMLEGALASQAVSKALGEVGQTVQESSETRMRGRLFSYFRDYVQCINEVLGGQNRVYIADAFVLDLEQNVFNAARNSARRRIEAKLDTRRVAVIGAVGAMVARSVANRVARRIGGRIAGRVAGRAGSRFIPLLGWVLIGTEVNDASNGTYVRQLSNEIRDVQPVQDEILRSVTNGVTGAYHDALTEVREDIFDAYKTFKVKYHDVLQMRRKYDDFNDFLVREATGANFRRLKALREQLPDEEILSAMRSGALADVIALTDRQFEHVQNIITATGSFDTAFRWLQIARDRLPLVVDARLYEFVPLDRMPQELISRILRWGDIEAIRSLGSVPQRHYGTLSKMTNSQWKLLLGAGDSSEKISKHLALVSILDQANTNMLLQGAHRTPGRIDFLFGEREILGELDADQQLEVLDFVLRSSFSERLQSLFSGSQRGTMLRYFWLSYWWVVVAFLIVIVVAVPLVRRVTGRSGGTSVES